MPAGASSGNTWITDVPLHVTAGKALVYSYQLLASLNTHTHTYTPPLELEGMHKFHCWFINFHVLAQQALGGFGIA